MPIKIIITLVFAFLLVLFGIFNTSPVEINLFGFTNVSTLLSFFVFVVFLAGGVFAGFLSFSEQVKQSLTIRKLKKKIKSLAEALEEQEKRDLIPAAGSKKPCGEIDKEGSLEDEPSNGELAGGGSNIDADLRLTPTQRKIALLKIKEQEKELSKGISEEKKENSLPDEK